MGEERSELRVMNERTKRLFVGDYQEWVVFLPVAVGLGFLFYIVASQMGQEIINLVPRDVFDLVVVSVSVILGVMVGYSRGGLLLSLSVVASIWFGSVYYGAMQSAPDIVRPGVGYAFFVANITAIVFGIPAYAFGRILRVLERWLHDQSFTRSNSP